MAKTQGTSLLHINTLRSWSTSVSIEVNGATKWVHKRPKGLTSFRERLSIAFKVFKGEADAVVWEQQ